MPNKSNTIAYLLVWKPSQKTFEWPDISEVASITRKHQIPEGGTGKSTWTVTTDNPSTGDRLFIYKTQNSKNSAYPGHGLIASGYFATSPEKMNGNPKDKQREVQICLDVVLDPHKDKLLSLNSHDIKKFSINVRASGNRIENLDQLENLWLTHLSKQGITPTPKKLIEQYIANLNENGTKNKSSQDSSNHSITDMLATKQPFKDTHQVLAPTPSPYTLTDALTDCFLEEPELTNLLHSWKSTRNLILSGPPGTGKSHIAQILAQVLLNQKNSPNITSIQFHQSYSYEDFIQGWRPTSNQSFQMTDGLLVTLAKAAQEKPQVLIIDEINRGNVAQIFGEALTLIESSKRGKHHLKIKSATPGNDATFTIPPDLYILGTMNTADRSLAAFDAALRRRFAFHELKSKINSPKFKLHLQQKNIPAPTIQLIQTLVKNLDGLIQNAPDLGEHFLLGHSYFCNPTTDTTAWLSEIADHHLKPLLEDYWPNTKHRSPAIKLLETFKTELAKALPGE